MLGKLPLPRFQQPGAGSAARTGAGGGARTGSTAGGSSTAGGGSTAACSTIGAATGAGGGEDDVLPSMLVAVDCTRSRSESWPSSQSTVKMATCQAGRQNIYSKTAKHQPRNEDARKRGNSNA